MELNNGVLKLKLENKGGEMSSLEYQGFDILYKGDGPYWSGKNPTLFPMISSPSKKEYTIDGVTYPCRNHGLIRYATLDTVIDNASEVKMNLKSSTETLKEYPFNFDYNITYKLDNDTVLINYDITNIDNKVMPFTFGLHPGFNIKSFDEVKIVFDNDEMGEIFNKNDESSKLVDLKEYTGKRFLEDLSIMKTVMFKNLKSKYVTLQTNEYNVKIDISKFKYLALWTQDPDAKYICIEPWLSINDIVNAENPFADEFELVHLKPQETFRIDYSIKVCKG